MRATRGAGRGVVVDLAYMDEDDVVVPEPIHHGRRLKRPPQGLRVEGDPALLADAHPEPEADDGGPRRLGGSRGAVRDARPRNPRWQIWL